MLKDLLGRCVATAKRYPFSIGFALSFIVLSAYLFNSSVKDNAYYEQAEQRMDSYLLDSFNFKQCIAHDTSKAASRLMQSMKILKERKDSKFEDANYYYERLYFYSHILGIYAIIGSVILMLVVTKGWAGSPPDLKLALGAIFVACSISYFIPKLMGNEQNYKNNTAAYFTYNRQLHYSVQVLSYHCCCDKSRNPDSVLNAASDSNFSVINSTMAWYYDIDFNEAMKYFEQFKSDKAFKKQE